MADSNLSVSFGSPISSVNPSISLDEEYNTSIYVDESKNTFFKNEIAYLKILPSWSQRNYSLESSYGTLSKLSQGISYPVEEYIDFVDESSGELSFVPSGSVSYEWIGNSLGTPLFTDNTVTITDKGVGRLKCNYNSIGDRLKLTGVDLEYEEDYDVVCAALYEDEESYKTSVNVAYTGQGVTTAKVRVIVKNICDNTIITGASVNISGLGSGTTNSDGVFVTENEGTVGATYSIKVTKSGYVSSDVDFLNNDEFVLSDPVD